MHQPGERASTVQHRDGRTVDKGIAREARAGVSKHSLCYGHAAAVPHSVRKVLRHVLEESVLQPHTLYYDGALLLTSP